MSCSMADPCSCGRTDTRLYAEGWRCPACTPARRMGRPEPDTARYCAPLRCYCGGQCGAQPPGPLDPITATVTDDNAVVSGKRRSSPAQYAEARARTDERRNR